jgi:hypothetical protein
MVCEHEYMNMCTPNYRSGYGTALPQIERLISHRRERDHHPHNANKMNQPVQY